MPLSTLRQPIALLPIAMSAAALVIILAHIVLAGTARQADEGLEAHLWQILMAGQLPLIAFFALRWLPERPRETLLILALQLAAAVTAAAPVRLLNW